MEKNWLSFKFGLKGKQEPFERENDLIELRKLKIRGGPVDLSEKLDFYHYRENSCDGEMNR